MGVKVNLEFINVFKNSQSISIMKGKPHFLTREPKKTKDQLKIDKIEEEKEKEKAHSKIDKMKRDLQLLKLKMEEYALKQREVDINTDKLAKLYKLGLIDENGDPIKTIWANNDCLTNIFTIFTIDWPKKSNIA